MQGFPAYYFKHATGEQRLFGSELELAAAGHGWFDTQAKPAAPKQITAKEEVIAPAADGSRLKNKKKAD